MNRQYPYTPFQSSHAGADFRTQHNFSDSNGGNGSIFSGYVMCFRAYGFIQMAANIEKKPKAGLKNRINSLRQDIFKPSSNRFSYFNYLSSQKFHKRIRFHKNMYLYTL
jgi:hypothetical protein